MFTFILTLALLGQCDDDCAVPLVEEEVCEIALIYRTDQLEYFPCIYFVKAGGILDSRGHCDSMQLHVVDERFCLMWRDWANVERVVWAKRIGVYELEPLGQVEDGPWWAANRPMRSLRAPPAQ